MGDTAALFTEEPWLHAFAVVPRQAVLECIAFPEFFLMESQPVLFSVWSNLPLLVPETFIAVSLCLLLSISEGDNACLKCSLDRSMWILCVCSWLRIPAMRVSLVFVLIACDCSALLPVDSVCVVICSLFICLCKGHLLSTCSGAGAVGRHWWIQVWFFTLDVFLQWASSKSEVLTDRSPSLYYTSLPPEGPISLQGNSGSFCKKQTPASTVFPSQCPYCDV